MNKVFSILAAAGIAAGVPAGVSAQVPGNPLAEARARVACGAGTLVSANYIGGGMLRVTCSQPNTQTQSAPAAESALTGTGLTVPPALGVVIGVSVIAIIGGEGNEVTTTTTTTESLPAASETTGGDR